MPIYEYACGACGCRIEVLQGINDLPLTQCEQCHKPALQKLVSSALFRLKGGGWYETDFKKEGDKKKNLANREESVPSVKSESGKDTVSSTPPSSSPSPSPSSATSSESTTTKSETGK